MTKTKSPSTQQAPDSLLVQRQNAAQQSMVNQERSDNWSMLPGSAPVKFMNHWNGMCRWPIGDPHHLETFRFCGCDCPAEASYCEAHRKMAFAPNRVRPAQPGKGLPPFGTKVA